MRGKRTLSLEPLWKPHMSMAVVCQWLTFPSPPRPLAIHAGIAHAHVGGVACRALKYTLCTYGAALLATAGVTWQGWQRPLVLHTVPAVLIALAIACKVVPPHA